MFSARSRLTSETYSFEPWISKTALAASRRKKRKKPIVGMLPA